jgi:hypothetical protein
MMTYLLSLLPAAGCVAMMLGGGALTRRLATGAFGRSLRRQIPHARGDRQASPGRSRS